jgi:hypothetical protein
MRANCRRCGARGRCGGMRRRIGIMIMARSGRSGRARISTFHNLYNLFKMIHRLKKKWKIDQKNFGISHRK